MTTPAPRSSRSARPLWLVLGAAAAVVALFGGELGGAAARALAVCALLGGAALALRRGRRDRGAPHAVAVLERHALAKDIGIAVVRAGSERLLVGYGPGGASLLGELAAAPKEDRT